MLPPRHTTPVTPHLFNSSNIKISISANGNLRLIASVYTPCCNSLPLKVQGTDHNLQQQKLLKTSCKLIGLMMTES